MIVLTNTVNKLCTSLSFDWLNVDIRLVTTLFLYHGDITDNLYWCNGDSPLVFLTTVIVLNFVEINKVEIDTREPCMKVIS